MEALALDTYFTELYDTYGAIKEAVDLFYAAYLETGSIADA